MALKTFNLDDEVYGEFSKHCKEHGFSMSKKVNKFIQEELKRLKDPDGFENPAERDRQERERKLNPRLDIDPDKLDPAGHPMGRYC